MTRGFSILPTALPSWTTVTSSELNVKQSEAILATSEATVPTLETTLTQAIHRLGVLLGEQPGALLAELSSTEPIPATPANVPVGLPSELLPRRPFCQRKKKMSKIRSLAEV